MPERASSNSAIRPMPPAARWSWPWKFATSVMVFSFNHSPIISAFAVDQKRRHGDNAEVRSSQILSRAHVLMVVMVLFFSVWPRVFGRRALGQTRRRHQSHFRQLRRLQRKI